MAGALFLGVLIVMTTSCKKAVLRSQLKDLMASTIVLPEKISCVDNGEVFPMPDSLRDMAKLIVYIDSSDCSTCRISHLGKYHKIFQMSKETGMFEVVLLFANIDLSGMPVERYVSDSEVGCPVYFDLENKFLELNPSVAADSRLHSFLVDSAGTPLFVGDPIVSREMLRIFTEAAYKLTN